jgi:hypothetical protein
MSRALCNEPKLAVVARGQGELGRATVLLKADVGDSDVVVVGLRPAPPDRTALSAARMGDDEYRKSQGLGFTKRKDLVFVPYGRPSRPGIVVDQTILAEVIVVVLAGVQHGDGDPARAQDSGALLVHPDTLGSAVHPEGA